MLLTHFFVSGSLSKLNKQVLCSGGLQSAGTCSNQPYKRCVINKHIGFYRARWLVLALLGLVWASTAFGVGCDPVIEGGYGIKITDAAVYSGCTTTVIAAEQTVSINYHRDGYIYTVTASSGQYLPNAPASTASIGSLAPDTYKSQDMETHYKGDCRDMKGKTGFNPPAVAGHYYCFYFPGSDADLFLGGYLKEANLFESGTASIVLPSTDDFITTWKTDNPGTSNDTSITVPILGGPYDVDWNDDGIFDEIGLSGVVTHDYGATGTYTIRIRGTYDAILFNNGGDKEKILSLDQWGTNSWTSMRSAFNGAVNLTLPATDTPNFSAVTLMSHMFRDATSADPDTSGWDTSAVRTMEYMFDGATLANPDTSDWDTGAVLNMGYMFRNATLASPDTSGWDTAAIVDMTAMFSGATSFDQDIGSWNVTALTGAANMFLRVTLSTANYDSLLIGWDAQVLKTGVPFTGGNSVYCSESAVAARANMIASDSWTIVDGGQCVDPADDFVTTWKTDNPGTSNDTSITVPMVGGPYDVDWDDDGTFDETVLNGPVTHDYGVTGMHTIRIRGTYGSIEFKNGGDKQKILSLDQWGTNKWTTMVSAFYGAFNLTIAATDTPDFSAVTSMYSMFRGAISANPDTGGWDTSAVKYMDYMFRGATSANPDTGGWDTSAVKYMDYMFQFATSANPNTNGWVTSAVITMESMFQGAALADPDTSSWDTAAVEDMSSMFHGATSANPDTSGWNTAKVYRMIRMFDGATSFDRDLGSWDVTALEDAASMFNAVTLSTANYDSLLTGWNAQALLTGVLFNGGGSTYCSESAVTARANMMASDSWVITDGGYECSAATFTVGGNVSGLVGSGLVLQNKVADDLAISANGDFTFATALDDGVAYVVTILTQPADPIQVCSVSNGSGNLDGADIVNVTVTCVDESENIFTDGFEE